MSRLDKALAVAVVLVAVITGSGVMGLVLDARSNDTRLRLDTSTYQQDIRGWHEKLRGCTRTKADRTSTARALRAQSTYLNLVLAADSVMEDVKRAARTAQSIFNASATNLESRTGDRLLCTVVYPKPPAPAGVTPLP